MTGNLHIAYSETTFKLGQVNTENSKPSKCKYPRRRSGGELRAGRPKHWKVPLKLLQPFAFNPFLSILNRYRAIPIGLNCKSRQGKKNHEVGTDYCFPEDQGSKDLLTFLPTTYVHILR